MWLRHRRNHNLRLIYKAAVILIIIIAIEEFFISYFYKSWKNYYHEVVYRPIEVTRTDDKRIDVGVLVVVEKQKHLQNYEIAQDTVTCYCRKFKYKLIRIALDRAPDLVKKCPQKDFMFQRHCITINVLQKNPDLKYLLFLDADMGIINPNHLIEEYIDPSYDLLFYERIFNFEVMAGSYIVKNTPYAGQFLKEWVDYEAKLPKSFHGTDNAAIHQILVDWYNPNDKRDRQCRELWEKSSDWDGVWKYVACSRSLLNTTLVFDRIKIIPKASPLAWARDGWLTDSHWSSRDFIFHGWQKRRLNSLDFAGWFNPFVTDEPLRLPRCSGAKAYLNWQYKDTYIETDEAINEQLKAISDTVKVKYELMVKQIWS